MELLFLGSGSGLSKDLNNFQSNMILTAPSKKQLLIDCGTDIRFSLAAQNISYQDITGVYISHLHADHSGGLEWFAFNCKFDGNNHKPYLFADAKLRKLLWKNSLSGGMCTLRNHQAKLNLYFKIKKHADNHHFVWENIPFQLVPTKHMYSNHKQIPSFGLIFGEENNKVFITTDAQFDREGFMPHYQSAKLIFQDCETSSFRSSVHAHFDELSTLPDEIKAKMWLYHYSEGTLPDAKKAGFLGFVEKGQRFDLTSQI